MKFILLTASLLIIAATETQGQSKATYHQLDSLAAHYRGIDIEKSLDYMHQAVGEVQLLKDSSLITEAFANLSRSLSDKGDYQASLINWAKALSYAPATVDSIKSLRGIGIVYADAGQSDQALSYFLQALRLAENNHKYRLRMLNEIGLLHRDIGEYEKAMEYFRDLLALKKQINDPTFYQSLMNIGLINLDFNQYDSAIHYFNLSFDGMDKEKDLFGVSLYHNNMGSALSDMGRYKEALPHAEKAIDLIEKEGRKRRMANTYNLLTFIHLGLKNNSQAEKYAMQARALQDSSSATRIKTNTLRYLIEAKVRQRDTTEVLDLMYELLTIKNEQHDIEKTEAFSEMMTKFELEKKEKEILSLGVGGDNSRVTNRVITARYTIFTFLPYSFLVRLPAFLSFIVVETHWCGIGSISTFLKLLLFNYFHHCYDWR